MIISLNMGHNKSQNCTQVNEDFNEMKFVLKLFFILSNLRQKSKVTLGPCIQNNAPLHSCCNHIYLLLTTSVHNIFCPQVLKKFLGFYENSLAISQQNWSQCKYYDLDNTEGIFLKKNFSARQYLLVCLHPFNSTSTS